MDIETIKTQLEFYTQTFPEDALRAAIAQREAITPLLLASLQAVADSPDEVAGKPSLMLHLYAMYLLAQFREQAAYPLLVKFFSTPGEISLDATGDVITEDLGRILASVCQREIAPIQRMIEDPAVNEYVRSASLRALTVLVVEEELPREQVIDYFRTLFHGKLERESDYILSALISECCDLYPEELLQEIERAFDDDLVDLSYIRMDSVRNALMEGKEEVLQKTKQRRGNLIYDTIAEMRWWACFKPDTDTPATTYRPTTKHVMTKTDKVGRNDPCPCGSGKKYKKCCLH
ncbi:hypothetical protein CCR95_09690 [Thiocystis minor]|uniref:DUF1186 domain-containing protein n=1 Tax=Thiocystis minor TaxID=61597 RepID=UPI001F5C568F|nr:DUF1186 domain-containing protein [Thiocystis minor]MBK5964349.1 hypothetical protein [Thiocystis minor]